MIALVINIVLSACAAEELTGPITISGQVTISKNPIVNGEGVYLSIGTLRFDVSGNLIKVNSYQIASEKNKETGIPKVHYYIDDIEVGSSNDKANNFVIEYTSHLRQGIHKLRAEAEPQEDNITFTGSYTPTNFFVVEDISVP